MGNHGWGAEGCRQRKLQAAEAMLVMVEEHSADADADKKETVISCKNKTAVLANTFTIMGSFFPWAGFVEEGVIRCRYRHHGHDDDTDRRTTSAAVPVAVLHNIFSLEKKKKKTP